MLTKEDENSALKHHASVDRWRKPVQLILTIWFFIGMPLSILLSGFYMLFGFALPPILFFLPSLTYLSGGILGVIVSGESLVRSKHSDSQFFGGFLILVVSIAFLSMSIIFAAVGFRRL